MMHYNLFGTEMAIQVGLFLHMVGSLQEGPQESLPSGFHSLCSPLSHCTRVGLCDPESRAEMIVHHFQD